MNITPLKVTVREVVTGYVDASDREECIYGYSGRLNIRPKYQRGYSRGLSPAGIISMWASESS